MVKSIHIRIKPDSFKDSFRGKPHPTSANAAAFKETLWASLKAARDLASRKASRIMTPAYLAVCDQPKVAVASARLRHLRAIDADPAVIARAERLLKRRIASA